MHLLWGPMGGWVHLHDVLGEVSHVLVTCVPQECTKALDTFVDHCGAMVSWGDQQHNSMCRK